MKEYEDVDERNKWEEVSASIELVTENNEDGGGGALDKAWLAGRGGKRGEAPDYGGGVYVDIRNREL